MTVERIFSGQDIKLVKRKKLDTDLYCLTAEEFSRGRSNVDVVKAMIRAGVKLIQYREKGKKLSEKYRECMELRELTAAAGVTFIINDHIDLALMVQADGVHVGQDDLPVEQIRKLVGNEMIIGLSTHSPEQARAAVEKGVDYIGVGPIFRTYTKKDVVDPVGLEYLEYVKKNISIPFVAIGGIKEGNIREVKERGARCFALVTEIVGADCIESKIDSIREKIKD